MANFGSPQKVRETTEIFEQGSKMTTMALETIHMPGTYKMEKEKSLRSFLMEKIKRNKDLNTVVEVRIQR